MFTIDCFPRISEVILALLVLHRKGAREISGIANCNSDQQFFPNGDGGSQEDNGHGRQEILPVAATILQSAPLVSPLLQIRYLHRSIPSLPFFPTESFNARMI
jgi:hypothetical protein